MPDDRKPLPLRPGAGRIEPVLKGIPGPTIREGGGSLPCGCHVAHDEDKKLRVYFCAPHAVAYEMLEALQQSLALIDDLANNPPSPDYDVTPAMEAAMKMRKVLKKAKGSWG